MLLLVIVRDLFVLICNARKEDAKQVQTDCYCILEFLQNAN